MTEKDKTIDGMSVRKPTIRRTTTGIDGLKPASGTKTTVSRAVRMRQAEKVLREREAKERTIRAARMRMARIKAAQLRTASDNTVRQTKPVRTTSPAVMPSIKKTATRSTAGQRVQAARSASARLAANQQTVPIRHPQTSPRSQQVTPRPQQITSRPARVLQRPQQLTAKQQQAIEEINQDEGRLARAETVNDFLAPVRSFDDEPFEDKTTSRRPMRERTEEVEEEPKKRRKFGLFKWFRRLFILAILGGIGYGVFWGNGLISKITGGKSGLFDLIGVISNSYVELKKGNNGRTNVLVFGTSGYEMDGSGHDGAQLTDSIMAVSFDEASKDVAMVNLPRDLYVGGSCMPTGKINELYWCANLDDKNEAAGAKALGDKVSEVLGMDFQYYAHLNWGALVQIIDAIGGVTVTLDEDIQDSWTNTYIKKDTPTTLNGEQALGLARARHGTEQGDFSRGASQQKLLIALEQKVLEKGLDVGQALALINSLGDNLRTDFSLEEIKSLAHAAMEMDIANMRQVSLSDLESGSVYITSTMMPVNGIDISYVVPTAGTSTYGPIKKYIAREFSTDLSTREGANILVLNGSGEAGVAAKERDSLESSGFIVKQISDAPDGEYPSRYYLYDVTGTCPGTLTSLEKRYNIKATPIETLPEGIESQGFDFIVIIGEPEE